MAATLTVSSFGRIAVLGNMAAVVVTINGNGATYTAASGGLPIDLTQVIKNASPFSAEINPGDVTAVLVPLGLSANGFLPGGLVLGTATFTNLPGASVRVPQTLATFPATVRLYGIGAANTVGSALGEVANGVNNDSFTALLIIARGGTNIN